MTNREAAIISKFVEEVYFSGHSFRESMDLIWTLIIGGIIETKPEGHA